MKEGNYTGNNLLLMLTLIFIVFSIWSTWMTTTFVEMTGKAAKAEISFCYQQYKPYIVIDYPRKNEIISGNYTIRSYAEHLPEAVYLVKFYIQNNFMRSYLGNVTESSGNYFNLEFDTTQFEDRNCGYVIHARANFTSCTPYDEDYSDVFTINNIDEPPIWENFRNNLTTNFSQFTSWVALKNVTIGIPNKVWIDFGASTINLDGADLDSLLTMEHNFLDIGDIPCVTSDLLNIKPIITFYNISYFNPQIYRNGAPCPLASCQPLNYTNGTFVFRLLRNGPAAYSLVEGSYAKLSITDDTQSPRDYFVNEPVTFYANLTDGATHTPIHGSGVYCLIKFELDYEEPQEYFMEYNPDTRLYEYTRSFPHPNKRGYNDDWGVYCNASAQDLDEVGWVFSKFEIVNRGPVQIATLPNETWAWNTILIGRDLDDYFVDPDNDPLNFSLLYPVDNIYIEINKTSHVVTYIPSTDWYGNRTAFFVATDPFNASAISNEVWLEVVKIPQPPPPKKREEVTPTLIPKCKPNWVCGNWSKCLPSGIQTRECKDLNNCNVSLWVPETVRNCTYIPTCDDKIKNQGEEGVDCGGPCPPCPTCFDGIKNQGEEGIDCGGPCPPCPSCSDGIKNGDEEGVDCGGSVCPPCEKTYVLEKPQVSKAFWSIFLMSLALALGFSIILRAQIRKLLDTLLGLLGGLLRRKPTTSLFDAYITPYIEFMAALRELGRKKPTIMELKDVVECFLMFIFGDHTHGRLPLFISHTSHLSQGLRSRILNLHTQLFLKVPSGNLKQLLSEVRAVIRDTFIEIFVASGMQLSEIFDSMVAYFYTWRKSRPRLAAEVRDEAYYVYVRLPLETKGKVYKKLREIDSVEVGEMTSKHRNLLILAGLVLAMGLVGFIIGPAMTGYYGFNVEELPLKIEDIPDAEIEVGEPFVYRVVVQGGTPPVRFFDDTEHFEIDEQSGLISFTPGISALGRNFATITVVDSEGRNVSTEFKFTVYR